MQNLFEGLDLPKNSYVYKFKVIKDNKIVHKETRLTFGVDIFEALSLASFILRQEFSYACEIDIFYIRRIEQDHE